MDGLGSITSWENPSSFAPGPSLISYEASHCKLNPIAQRFQYYIALDIIKET